MKVTDELLDQLVRLATAAPWPVPVCAEDVLVLAAEVRRLRAEQVKWSNLVAQAYVDARREEREVCIAAAIAQYDNSVGERSARFNDGVAAAIDAIRARGD